MGMRKAFSYGMPFLRAWDMRSSVAKRQNVAGWISRTFEWRSDSREIAMPYDVKSRSFGYKTKAAVLFAMIAAA